MKKYIIIIIIFLGSIPLFSQNYSGGDGTKANPYQISTLEDLRYLSEKGEAHWDKYFIMANDIDASDTKSWNVGDHDGDSTTADEPMGWEPIGNSTNSFTGNFDGKNYKISNLYLHNLQSECGLFGEISNSLLKNIKVNNSDIRGGDYTGVLCGFVYNSSIINCSATGQINGKSYTGGLCGINILSIISGCYFIGEIEGGNIVGGLCGTNDRSKIIDSYSTGSVYGNNSVGGLCAVNERSYIYNSFSKGAITGNYDIGGLCGKNYNGDIKNCYSTGEVTGNYDVGGFCGTNYNGIISSSYSTGEVYGNEFVGGFCGENSPDFTTIRSSFASNKLNDNDIYGVIKNCYSTGNVNANKIVGGFCGLSFGNVIHSYSTGSLNGKSKVGGFASVYEYQAKSLENFWDIETSGMTDSEGAEGKSTLEMKTKSTFTDSDWNFYFIWNIDGTTNSGYPFLQMKPVSVSDAEKNDFNFTIYPNPAKNIINIDAEDRIEKIEIYDINGLLLIETYKKQIDVSRLQNGIYQIVLRKSNQIQTEQLIIMR
jgi:hypothetical protein